MNKFLNRKIIPLLLLISLLSLQIIFPLQTLADNNLLNYNNPNANGKNPYKLSLDSVIDSRMLTSVVSCTGITNKLAGKLFELNEKINDELDEQLAKQLKIITNRHRDKLIRQQREKALQGMREAILNGKGLLGAIAGGATYLGTGLPALGNLPIATQTDKPKPTTVKVEDEAVLKQREEQEKERIKKEKEEIAKQQREKCFNGIAISLARSQLTSMTKYTMNWVNSGFNGDPMYVTNVTSFLDSVSQEILQQELAKWKTGSEQDYPWGKSFARRQVEGYRSSKDATGSLKQTLTSYLEPGTTVEKYSDDFSSGGWDGWLALTQKSENNPLGFNINATELLNKKRQEAVEMYSDEINRNEGYLDQKECVEWAGVDDDPNPDGSPKCLQFKTVTPGSNIKTKIDTYVNTPERQIELVRTMDDALNSLFAMLLNQFANQGLYGLRSADNNFTGNGTGGFGINQIFDADGNSLTGNTGSGSTINTGYFSLTKDLGNTYTDESLKGKLKIENRGILQMQYDYIKLLDKSKLVLDKVVPSVAKLDYCIPGPNPNWFNNSRDAMDEYLDYASSYDDSFTEIDPTRVPPIKLEELENKINTYESEVTKTYGPDSPMQTMSLTNPNYLKMSMEGLNITKDLVNYSDAITEAKDTYKQDLIDTNTAITKLNVIKDKVNKIVGQAQKRRTADRVAEGKPAMKAICLAVEKVTYLDGDVLK